ncbi:lysine transporter LysE, partial [Pseudomonas aeruginosa]
SMLLVLGLLASVPDPAHSALRWLQALGGLYFLWLAGQALLAHRRLEIPAQRDLPSSGGYLRGLRDGLLASSLNPKLPIFYAGLFGVLARFSLPGWALALCLAWMSLVVLCWDMALVRLLDRPRWRGWLQRRVGALDRLCGVLLLALGGWLVLAAL